MAEPRAAGTIYDLGYQQYGGARLGRVNAVRNLFTFSFRSAFGLGRGSRSKVSQLSCVVVTMVALAMIVMAGHRRPSIVNYARS
jgi:ABC-2 type transport system permease protein